MYLESLLEKQLPPLEELSKMNDVKPIKEFNEKQDKLEVSEQCPEKIPYKTDSLTDQVNLILPQESETKFILKEINTSNTNSISDLKCDIMSRTDDDSILVLSNADLLHQENKDLLHNIMEETKNNENTSSVASMKVLPEQSNL